MKRHFKMLSDFANEAWQEIGRYQVNFFLPPTLMKHEDYPIDELNWDSVAYAVTEEIEKVPNDKRGIYAFTICQPNNVLPSHGYVIYVGITGLKSGRTLQIRYKEYLNPKTVMKRPHIARAIGDWREVLRFYFAPVKDDLPVEDLKALEKKINSALLPPFSKNDLEAVIKSKRDAFR